MKDLTTIIAAIVAFGVTAISGYFVIPYLRKLKFGQTILDIGPNWHKTKQGTPTMGGVMIIFGVIVGVIVSIIASFIYGGALFNTFKISSLFPVQKWVTLYFLQISDTSSIHSSKVSLSGI